MSTYYRREDGDGDLEDCTEKVKQALESQELLDKLEAAGVDNWDGYEDALGME